MKITKQVTYIGPDADLRNCPALAKASDKEDTILVQFTFTNSCPDIKDVVEPSTKAEKWLFDWHEMPAHHFEERKGF